MYRRYPQMIRRELDSHPHMQGQARRQILKSICFSGFRCPPRLSSMFPFSLIVYYWDIIGQGTTTTKLDALDDVICINVLDAAAACSRAAKLASLTHC